MTRLLKILTLAAFSIGALGMSASAQEASMLTGHAAVGYAKMTNSGPFKDAEVDAPGGSVGFALGLTMYLPAGLGFGAELGYHLLGSQDVTLTGDLDVEQTLSLIPVTAQAYYMFPLESTTRPWVTVGAGSYTQRVETSGDLDDTENQSKFGWNIGAGVDFRPPAGGMAFGFEGRYHTANNEDPVDASHFFTIAARLYLDQMFD